MFEITPMGVALIGAVAVAAFALAKLLFKKDTEIENRRKDAINASGELKKMGFSRLPEIFTNYAVGDYSGLAHDLKSAVRMLLDPKQRESELSDVFARQLEARMSDPEQRRPLLEKIQRLAAVYEPGAVPAESRTASGAAGSVGL